MQSPPQSVLENFLYPKEEFLYQLLPISSWPPPPQSLAPLIYFLWICLFRIFYTNGILWLILAICDLSSLVLKFELHKVPQNIDDSKGITERRWSNIISESELPLQWTWVSDFLLCFFFLCFNLITTKVLVWWILE